MVRPLVVSVRSISLYDMDTSTGCWPPGQSRGGGDMGGRRAVTEPTTFPLSSASNVLLPTTSLVVVCFLGSLGKFPPPFWHAKSKLACPSHSMVTLSLFPKPASLKLHTRFPSLSILALDTDLIKCGLAASAGVIEDEDNATASAATITAYVIFIFDFEVQLH